MSKKLGVGLYYTSGKLIDIIINLPQGVQMLTLTKDVDGVPFSADENYIIVFKGTKYTNGAFARIMAFQGNQFDTFKLGMVTWDASSVSWNDVATKSDLNTWEDITSDCTLANGISIGTFKVYKNTAQKLIKMNGYLTITSEQKVAKTLLTFPSNIKLIGYQYVLAYNANTADSYGVYGTDANILRNDTKNIPVMNYFVIPNVTMSYNL